MLRRNTGVKVFAANEEIVLDRGMPEYVSVSLYCFALICSIFPLFYLQSGGLFFSAFTSLLC